MYFRPYKSIYNGKLGAHLVCIVFFSQAAATFNWPTKAPAQRSHRAAPPDPAADASGSWEDLGGWPSLCGAIPGGVYTNILINIYIYT